MTSAAELPRQIVDQLRAERGGIVDFAVECGRIVISEKEGVSNVSNSSKNP